MKRPVSPWRLQRCSWLQLDPAVLSQLRLPGSMKAPHFTDLPGLQVHDFRSAQRVPKHRQGRGSVFSRPLHGNRGDWRGTGNGGPRGRHRRLNCFGGIGRTQKVERSVHRSPVRETAGFPVNLVQWGQCWSAQQTQQYFSGSPRQRGSMTRYIESPLNKGTVVEADVLQQVGV